jgi:hypothetical protein
MVAPGVPSVRLGCLDGAVLEITAEPVCDRDGVPYEATLALRVDGRPAGRVGERCLDALADALARLTSAAHPGSPAARRWPDPLDRFPPTTLEEGLRRYAETAGLDPDLAWRTARPLLPRDGELFAFRHRDPDDPEGRAELRCQLRVDARWVDGRWRLSQRAVLDAWGDDGRAVRASLTAVALAELLRTLLTEAGVTLAALRPTG